MLQISDTIKDSKINKSEREKEKGDTSTDGPSGRPVVEISIENSP